MGSTGLSMGSSGLSMDFFFFLFFYLINSGGQATDLENNLFTVTFIPRRLQKATRLIIFAGLY